MKSDFSYKEIAAVKPSHAVFSKSIPQFFIREGRRGFEEPAPCAISLSLSIIHAKSRRVISVRLYR